MCPPPVPTRPTPAVRPTCRWTLRRPNRRSPVALRRRSPNAPKARARRPRARGNPSRRADMRLEALLQGVDGVDRPDGAGAIDVTAIAYDPRAVTAGALFCCVRGEHADGHDFAAAAVAAGAVALLVERRMTVVDPAVPQ